MSNKALLVIPEDGKDVIVELLKAKCDVGWEKHFDFYPLPRRATRSQKDEYTDDVIRRYYQMECTVLIVCRECACSERTIRKKLSPEEFLWIAEAVVHRDTVKDLAGRFGLLWLERADTQLLNWMWKKTDAAQWLAQFEDLGIGWVGEGLLRQFEVISSNELTRSFSINRASIYGTSVAYTFFEGEELGDSSKHIANLLPKLFPMDAIFGFQSIVADSKVRDLVYLFEDGLWSGVEVRKRLRLVDELYGDKSRPWQKLKLRFGVTTDFGLLVVRRFLLAKGFQSIEVDTSDAVRFLRFLPDVSDAECADEGRSEDEFIQWLHQIVSPAAFREETVWDGREKEAMAICRILGSQLVRQWLSQTPEKFTEARVERFTLGGGGFASTLVFSHSAPMVCLPVYWLFGVVEYQGKRCMWKPLVIDQRRLPPEAEWIC